MKNMQKHHKCIILVFCLISAIFITQILALVEQTWWACDINAKAPLHNLTLGSRDSVTVSIRMRTGLSDACWYVEEVDSTSVFSNILMSSSPIKKCLWEDLIGRFNETQWMKIENEIEISRSGKEILLKFKFDSPLFEFPQFRSNFYQLWSFFFTQIFLIS